eukprot:GHVN01055828.1.p1 GENE.GHVN01055828.1~~GHVN01055828.1.p1  ORF type:complete len:198 (+),score=32.45 GHVN01055828.1:997-1590(+)
MRLRSKLGFSSHRYLCQRPRSAYPSLPLNFCSLGSVTSTTSSSVMSARNSHTSSSPPSEGEKKNFSVTKSEDEWKAILTPEEYKIIRQADTERPHTGEYNKFYPTEGEFVCRACNTPLFPAAAKFNSGCGWPAFDKFYPGSVLTRPDNSISFSPRTEILCNTCGGHLGHEFKGERLTDTNTRHCVNSLSIKYVKANK